ncbi:MAG: hypothetical protein FJ319_14055 [SAR202 cluster bacterium]|nr:hypothetical protein [SAR202 cluster bacterium]
MKMPGSPVRLALLTMAFAALFGLIAAGCAAKSDPFAIGALADRTATPQGGAAAAAAGTPQSLSPTDSRISGTPVSLDVRKLGHVRLATWSSKDIDFINNLVGYIMVHGYQYTAELVDVTEPTYQAALAAGSVDVVMIAPKSESADWYAQNTGSGTVLDFGTAFSDSADKRIMVRADLKQSAPDLAEFLKKFNPGDAMVTDFAGRVTEGRVGIKANVAALTFLKNHQDIWSQWVPANVVTSVNAAIAAGKTNLKDRTCIPDGGSGGGSPNCGT